jgi:hypothetical protein
MVFGVLVAMLASSLTGGAVATAQAVSVTPATGTLGGHGDPASVIALNGTPIISPNGTVIGSLNNSTAHPWGEAYDPLNHCLYVTEDPMTATGKAYLTFLGPTNPVPTTLVIPGASDPQGIAWAVNFMGEPAAYATAFRYGVLAIADTGSNSISLYGVPLTTSANANCKPVFLGTGIGYFDYSSGALLATPWDIVFDLHTHLFYVTWESSNVVLALSGLAMGCEFLGNTSSPVGLSTDPAGNLLVANFMPNGWITQFRTTPGLAGDALPATICVGASVAKVSPPIMDLPVWPVYAPLLYPLRGTVLRNLVAVSDSSFNWPANLQGVGCSLAAPATHVMAELNDTGLGCSNSVKLDAAPPPLVSPGAFGIAYNTITHHVLEVLNEQGVVEGVDYTTVVLSAAAAPAAHVYESVEVIWFDPNTVASRAFYNWAATGGSMVVTNWAVGTLYVATGM